MFDIFYLTYYCVGMLVCIFFFIRGQAIFVLLGLYFSVQLDVQECLGTLSSYLCFLVSDSIQASSQNLSTFQTLREWITGSHRFDKGWLSQVFVDVTKTLNSVHSLCVDLVFYLSTTDQENLAALCCSVNRQLCISMEPTFLSWCHRTQVGIYIRWFVLWNLLHTKASCIPLERIVMVD